jgi:hypothetical protein
MEVTKVPQNRAQLELIAQGDKSKFPVVVEDVGGSVGGREGGTERLPGGLLFCFKAVVIGKF